MVNNTIIEIKDSIEIQAQNQISATEPTFILPYIVLFSIGLSFIVLLFVNKRINSWIYQRLPPTKLGSTPYDKLEIDDLRPIISNLNQHYRVLITVFGILLAFIVSDKISFALFNWNFIIWVGWVLGVIVKSAWNMIELSDIIERKSSIENIRFESYKNKQLIKHSFILLVFGIAFLPSFMFLESPSEDSLKNLPWDKSVSILAGAIGIISVTFGFTFILGLAPNEVAPNIKLMYAYVIFLFVLGSISSWSTLSPIEPKLVTFGAGITFEIPQIFVTVISFGSGSAYMMLFFFWEIWNTKRKKKKQEK